VRICIDATGWRALSRKLMHAAAGSQVSRAIPHIHAFQGSIESDLPQGSMWAVFDSRETSYYGWLVPKGEGRSAWRRVLAGASGRVEPRAGWPSLSLRLN
jgi:hypothetical protein